ncbi:MAG: HAMP domain-containing protein [Candidatus Omnitrophica bacterium]|nr:HAMP domain-containing protein [Candidatus Omnitrophota bacterium]
MKTKSIRFKTTILYSCILGAILVVFSIYIFHSVRGILHKNADDELKLKAEQVVATVNAYAEISGGRLPPTSLMREFLSDNAVALPGKEAIDKLWNKHRWLLGAHKDIFLIADINGKALMQSDNMPLGAREQIEQRTLKRFKDIVFDDLRVDRAAFRGVNYPFTFASRKLLVLYLAVPMSSVNRVLSQLLVLIVIGIGAVVFLSLFIGSFLTRSILRPMTEVTLTANNITQKNLGIRIPEKDLDEEMLLLVDSFNQMIDRLERSFAHINEFSSHAAHELKTPLAIIKGELEFALSTDNSREEDRRVMAVALREVERLIRITKDLLLLAKFEYKLNIFKMERMDLTAFIEDIAQHSQLLAAEKSITLDTEIAGEPLWVEGDATHLRRLFFNLVHNAVKFTPCGGRITLSMRVAEHRALVAVKDTGEGIAPENQQKIFDKFYSVPRQEAREPGGNGLGLCMARSIARAHGGDISVESALGQGAVFTVSIPLI